jgi:hypothetical protein
MKKSKTNNQKNILPKGLKRKPLIRDVSTKGKISKINMAPTIAITPISLFGIDLNTA